MNIREALMQQSPSLALQRAAADEIARLDAAVKAVTGAFGKAVEIIAKMDPQGAKKWLEEMEAGNV